MVIMAEEESDYMRRFVKYIESQSEKKKIPKKPKMLQKYLYELMELFAGEDYVIEQESSEHEGASWANITVNYSVLYPMNGFYQSNSSNRLVEKRMKASLMYWKDEKYHSLSFSDIKV
jgi:hypothetical protein